MVGTSVNWQIPSRPYRLMKASSLLIAILASAFVTSIHGQNAVSNGDFETGPLDTSSTVTNWTVGGGANVTQKDAYGATSPTHSAVFNDGANSQGNTISQVLSTSIGVPYTIDFDGAVEGAPDATMQLRVQVVGTGSLLDQTVTPPVTASPPVPPASFQHYQFTFTPDTTSTTLQFSDQGLGNTGSVTLLDTVVVVPAPTTLPLNNGDFETGPFGPAGSVYGWIVTGDVVVPSSSESSATTPTHTAVFND